MKLSNFFYKITRKTGKIGSTLNDIETITSLNPKKIAKRFIRKAIWKTVNKATQKAIQRFK